MKNLGYLVIIVICAIGYTHGIRKPDIDAFAPIGGLILWVAIGALLGGVWGQMMGDGDDDK